MDWEMLGWRQGVLLVVVVIVLYILALLVRLTRVGRRSPARPEQEPPLASPILPDQVVEVASPETEPAASHSPLRFEWDEVADLLGATANNEPAKAAPAPIPEEPPRAGGFGEHLADRLARFETEAEIGRLKAEIASLRSELEELRAARRVSPQYAEAMEMAQRGLTAQDVADRLGISLAEAELVHALSRGDRDFDVGEEDGAERNAGNDTDEAIDGIDRSWQQRGG